MTTDSTRKSYSRKGRKVKSVMKEEDDSHRLRDTLAAAA